MLSDGVEHFWPQPGDQSPRPAWRCISQDFVNTNDVEGDEDGLGTPELLGEWLAERGLLDRSTGVAEPAWRRAMDIREGRVPWAGSTWASRWTPPSWRP